MKDKLIEVVTVAQAAKELGISRFAVYKAIEAGNMESVEMLGKLGIPRRALSKYQPDEAKQRAGFARAAKSQV